MKSLALLAAALPVASAVYGVDISSPLDSGTASCMASNGASFGIVRAWCSYGGFDGNAPGSVANMWNAGFAHVDVYMFPCASASPSDQVSSLVSQLSANGVSYGQIWFDIETNPSDGCGWSDDTGANCDYITSLIQEAVALGVSPGIYASAYMWGSIMGGCTAGADNGIPLWYAHYDGNADFNDFSPFGNWGKPAMKQYAGDDSLCGFGVDDNYYPA